MLRLPAVSKLRPRRQAQAPAGRLRAVRPSRSNPPRPGCRPSADPGCHLSPPFARLPALGHAALPRRRGESKTRKRRKRNVPAVPDRQAFPFPATVLRRRNGPALPDRQAFPFPAAALRRRNGPAFRDRQAFPFRTTAARRRNGPPVPDRQACPVAESTARRRNGFPPRRPCPQRFCPAARPPASTSVRTVSNGVRSCRFRRRCSRTRLQDSRHSKGRKASTAPTRRSKKSREINGNFARLRRSAGASACHPAGIAALCALATIGQPPRCIYISRRMARTGIDGSGGRET